MQIKASQNFTELLQTKQAKLLEKFIGEDKQVEALTTALSEIRNSDGNSTLRTFLDRNTFMARTSGFVTSGLKTYISLRHAVANSIFYDAIGCVPGTINTTAFPQIINQGEHNAYGSFSGIDLSGADLSNLFFDANTSFRRSNLTEVNFTGANLAKVSFHSALLDKANLSGANLCGANLARASLEDTNLKGAFFDNKTIFSPGFDPIERGMITTLDFKNANLEGQDLSGMNLSYADFSGANLKNANLSGAFLTAVNFENANLTKANLEGVKLGNQFDRSLPKLKGAKFLAANLQNTNLQAIDFSGTDLRFAELQNSMMINAIIGNDTKVFACDHRNPYFDGLFANGDNKDRDFSNEDLSGLDLSERLQNVFLHMNYEDKSEGMSFKSANLEGTWFEGVDFGEDANLNFDYANLKNASFFKTRIGRSSFKHANLESVDFSGSNLTYLDFRHAKLKGAAFARLYKDRIRGANFLHADLTGTIFCSPRPPEMQSYPQIKFIDCDMRLSNWQKAKYKGSTHFWESNLVGEDLRDLQEEILGRFYFNSSNLEKANLSGLRIPIKKITGTYSMARMHQDKTRLRRADLSDTEFFRTGSSTTFENIDLSGANLERAKFQGLTLGPLVAFVAANLQDADLSDIGVVENHWGYRPSFKLADLTGANLKDADLAETWTYKTIGLNQGIENRDFQYTNLERLDLRNCDFSYCDFRNLKVRGANLQNTRFEKARLERAQFDFCDLRGSSLFEDVPFDNLGDNTYTFHWARTDGVGTANAGLKKYERTLIPLYFVDLSNRNFRGCVYGAADFFGADFSNSDLRQATLKNKTILAAAKARNANFDKAVLDGMDLSGVDLSNARFLNTAFKNVDVRVDTKFTDAILVPDYLLIQTDNDTHGRATTRNRAEFRGSKRFK